MWVLLTIVGKSRAGETSEKERQRKTIRKHINLKCRVAKEATKLNVSIEGCLQGWEGPETKKDF